MSQQVQLGEEWIEKDWCGDWQYRHAAAEKIYLLALHLKK